MITANVIHRVFRIRFNGSEGTCFTIDIDGREYLITAKHVVQDLSGTDTIDIFSNRDWSQQQVTLVGHSPEGADISVLSTTKLLTPPNLPMEATQKGLIYGQDTFFLGFPYGMTEEYITEGGGYPIPFVKKATVSMLKPTSLILDGHNNPGFSGGPVVFNGLSGNGFKVAAVISGYRFVKEPVFDKDDTSDFTYQYNTGLIVAHGIDWALDIIQSNPIGHPIN